LFLHAVHLDGFELFAWHIQVLFTNLVPKLLSGQTKAWENYTALFNNKEAIKRCKRDIKNLMDENDSRLRISDIVKRIRASVQNKSIVRFRSGCN